jgi:hypothetical protein
MCDSAQTITPAALAAIVESGLRLHAVLDTDGFAPSFDAQPLTLAMHA